MSGVSLRDRVFDALTRYYFTHLDDASRARGKSVGDSVERFADALAVDDGFGGALRELVMDGSADPSDVYGRYREVVKGEPAGTRTPPLPGSAFIPTPIGEVAIGPMRSLFDGRQLIPRAQRARVAVLTSPTTVRGLPHLHRIERVYFDGMRDSAIVDRVIDGGFRVRSTPYTFSMRDPDGVLITRNDHRDPFAIRVGRIRDEGDLRLAFAQYKSDFLRDAQGALHSIMAMTQNMRQLREAMGGWSDSFILGDTLREIQLLTLPLDIQAGVASGAFLANRYFGETLTGRAIQREVAEVDKAMLPVAFLLGAPALSASSAQLAPDDRRYELAARYSHLAAIFNGDGLGTLLNPVEHVLRVYGQRFGNADIGVETIGDPGRQLDPIPVRLILDEMIFMAAMGPPQGIRLLFDYPADMVMASYSRPQPGEQMDVIRYLQVLWGYSGHIGFEEVDGGFRAVIMGREPDRVDADRTTMVELAPLSDEEAPDTERGMSTLPVMSVAEELPAWTIQSPPPSIVYRDRDLSTQPVSPPPLSDTQEIDIKRISTMPAPPDTEQDDTEVMAAIPAEALTPTPVPVQNFGGIVEVEEEPRPTTPTHYVGSTAPVVYDECLPETDTFTPSILATIPCLMMPKMGR